MRTEEIGREAEGFTKEGYAYIHAELVPSKVSAIVSGNFAEMVGTIFHVMEKVSLDKAKAEDGSVSMTAYYAYLDLIMKGLKLMVKERKRQKISYRYVPRGGSE